MIATVVVYLSNAAAKTILVQYRSSTEVKLNIVIAGVGILTQDVCPLPVSIESSEIEPEPVYPGTTYVVSSVFRLTLREIS